MYTRIQELRGQVPLTNFIKHIINDAVAGPVGEMKQDISVASPMNIDSGSIQSILDSEAVLNLLKQINDDVGQIYVGVSDIWRSVVRK
jgi:hypothetical protein